MLSLKDSFGIVCACMYVISLGRVFIQNRPFRQGQMGTVFQYGHMGTPTEYYCSHMTLLERKSKWRLFPYHHMGTIAI